VAVLPSSVLSGLPGGSAASAGKAASSAAQAASGGSSGGVDSSALFGVLMRSATQVRGAWGSGRLLHTSLISMLITNDGRVLVGAVAPSVLYADAALGK
jgi:hypothetical protein